MEELIHQFMLVTQGVNAGWQDLLQAENLKGWDFISTARGAPNRLKIRAPLL
jgi:hypothetical protein